jgi:3-deoxy-manno-octulosonate cytidylyltransferase (CMP-KDO synthetase)
MVLVATDDCRIADAVNSFGGRFVMTRADHPSGTDRVAEVANNLDADIIINLQGDEPLIEPAMLDRLAELLRLCPSVPMATLATPIHSLEQWNNPACVKVVLTSEGEALYFSRSPIPFVRDGLPDFSRRPSPFLQHVGIYAYQRSFLISLAQSPTEPLEELERLEQLRVLALGHRIRVGVVAHSSLGVDTPQDYQRFVELYRDHRSTHAA